MVNNSDQSFSRPLSAGSAVSMATNPLSAAVDGAEGNSGVRMDLTQAAREGRPNGKAGIGIRATLAEDGLLILGEDLQHQAPQQLLRSQCGHLQQRRLCLTQLLPAGDPAQAASGSAPAAEPPQQVPRMPLVIAEEYCEINGQPHFKRTYNDGTVEFESW